MSEALIRGLIGGIILMLVAIIADIGWKIFRSRSEGVRRLKIVFIIASVLLFSALMIVNIGAVGTLGVATAAIAVLWVYRGFNLKNAKHNQYFESNSCRQDEFSESDLSKSSPEIRPSRKTVIECPNCASRLRVDAGKYIDVTCSKCKVVFRVHT